MHFKIFAAVSLATLATAASSFNPHVSVARPRAALPQTVARQLTNARRLSEGLPLNPPHLGSSRASRAVPSGTPGNLTSGYLQILYPPTGETLGFVGNTLNIYGEYVMVTDSADRLLVTVDPSAPGPVSLPTSNGPDADYPYIGGITGFSSNNSDLGAGSSNYNYFGGVQKSSPNAPPQVLNNTYTTVTNDPEATESAIFTYSADGNITVQWVNSDLSKPATYIGFLDNILFITGDMAAFQNAFNIVVWVSLRFVPQ